MEDNLTPWPEWRLEGLIGRGSHGSVWRASRTVGGYTARAAVKVIDIPRDQDDVSALASMGMDDGAIRAYLEDTANSLLREVAAMERLKGAPGVVAVEDYQLVRDPGDDMHWALYIRMELLESLQAIIRREGAPGPEEAARIGADLCRGLAFCHAEGVVHRDVKPANVFRSRFGEYKLGDFGIAARLDDATRSTMSFAGSPAYMAPEVSGGHYGRSVDVYSLGLMLYRWLNGGRPPFVPADGPVALSELDGAERRRASGERPPLPAGEGVDPGLAAVVRRAVEPRPADRWPSADSFGEALRGWLAGAVGPEVDGERTVCVVPGPGPLVEQGPERGEDAPADLAESRPEADAETGGRAENVKPPTGRDEPRDVDVLADTRDRDVPRCAGSLGSHGGGEGDPAERARVALNEGPEPADSEPEVSGANDGDGATVLVTPGGEEPSKRPGRPRPSRGEDVTVDLEVTAAEARDGALKRVEYDLPSGGRAESCAVRVPAGSADGDLVRVPGMGGHGAGGGGRGDLVARLVVRRGEGGSPAMLTRRSALALAGGALGLAAGALALRWARHDWRDIVVVSTGWRDLVAVSAGGYHTVGLRSDGTAVAAGNDGYGQCEVSGWGDLVAVSAGGWHTVGLRSDGTVVAAGDDDRGQCDVSGWRDLVAVSAGGWHTVGLRSDGTAVATGDNRHGQCEVSGWWGLVSVSAGERHTVGLRSDGTVVATGGNGYGQCDVSGWGDLVAVSAGERHTVGLRPDGTAVATGDNRHGQCEVSGWDDLVAVSAGGWHTVGLRSDGTAVAAGYNFWSQCDVADW